MKFLVAGIILTINSPLTMQMYRDNLFHSKDPKFVLDQLTDIVEIWRILSEDLKEKLGTLNETLTTLDPQSRPNDARLQFTTYMRMVAFYNIKLKSTLELFLYSSFEKTDEINRLTKSLEKLVKKVAKQISRIAEIANLGNMNFSLATMQRMQKMIDVQIGRAMATNLLLPNSSIHYEERLYKEVEKMLLKNHEDPQE